MLFLYIHYNDKSNLVEEIGFLEFIVNHVEAGIEISFFFSSIGIKTVLLFMMYVPIEWLDLVLYPVSFPFSTCMGRNEPGNSGRFNH